MKLIFNPYYDSKVYVKTTSCVIGEKVVGPQGLLAELELRVGLTGRYSDNFQRAVHYARAMKKAITKNTGLFFAKSFEKDKLGTAIVILGWRDALVKSGWNRLVTGSRRLDDLALVEACFEEKGEADRWRGLLDFARTSPLLGDDDCIVVTCEQRHLEPLYRQLFDSMSSQGCNVSYKPCAIDGNLHDKAIVYSFKNDIEMAEWLAQQPIGDNDVVVCDDTSILNLNLALDGKPQVGAESNAIGAIMQIFTLGLGLFNKPLNVNTLLAYLQLPAMPLNKLCVKRQDKDGKDYYKSLHRALIEQLVEDNGISEKWDALIDEAVYDYEGNDKTKSPERSMALLFINQWKQVSGQGDGCTVDKVVVVKYLESMKKWAKQNLYDEAKATQFNAIVSNCETMLMILDDEPDTIKTHDLMLWAAQINRPVELTTLSARRGAIDVTRAVTDIHTAPNVLYWACTTPEYRFQYELDFLNPEEIDILKTNRLEVADRETLLKARREMMLGVLSNVRERIVMLECEVIGGEIPVEDPVATELRHKGNLVIQAKVPELHDMEQKPVEAASEKQSEYQINPSVFGLLDTPKEDGGLKREAESYSSLDELIQRPFDYVMDYILHLKEYGKAAMADMDTVKGTVAHAYVEKLTEEGQRCVSSMRQIHNTRFVEIVSYLAETQGAILLLEENDLEFKRLKSLLKKSVDVLLDIIEKNNLTIVGAEQHYDANLPVIGKMTAYIDYVLTDNNGDYVIVDFKWSESKTYQTKLEQNDALQLAVYRAVLEQHLKDTSDPHRVSFMGYFVLPRHTLYTVYDSLRPQKGSIEVVEAESNSDLMQLAANSYTYRMNQLKAGLIEEGEGMELADLQYEKDAITQQLYPLRRDYYDKELKGTSYGNKNIVLKGGLV
ncbi:MAG: PD-(D/E)XK nuclease family protein [Bacteroidales bacterium]|nr:PD-(D/E)XK nuclease family protein [Bacteroidales bacterium]